MKPFTEINPSMSAWASTGCFAKENGYAFRYLSIQSVISFNRLIR